MNARQRAAARTREDVRLAARAVLAEKGYEATTIGDIAARAEVGQGTFYSAYLPSKDALPRALADELIADMTAAAEAALAQAERLPEAVDSVVEAVYAVATDHADVLLVANRAIDLADEEQSWLEVTAPLRGALEGMVRRFQETREAEPKLVPEDTAAILMDMLEHSARSAALFRRENLVAEVKRLFLRGLEAR